MSAHRYALGGPLLLSLTISACNFGRQPEDFPTALTPAGAHVAVRVRGENADRLGELYVADSVGLLIRGARLLRVRWAEVAAMDVDRLGSDYDVAFGENVAAQKRERLSLVSRFPKGLPSPMLERVLSLIPQAAVDSLR